jgi:hypothetical protein
MALTARLSVANRNAQLAAFAARLNNGYLRIYSGTQPATPETAAAGTLLAEHRFAATAFSTPDEGIALANPIDEEVALADGEATWFRALQSDGVTAELDGSVGTPDVPVPGDTYNCEIGATTISAGAIVEVATFTHSIPLQQCS